MKTLLIIVVVMLMVSPVMAAWNDVHVPDANTRALWHLDQSGADPLAIDASSYGNDATVAPRTSATWMTSAVPGVGFGNMASSEWNVGSWGTMQVPTSAGNDSLFFDNATNQTIEFWATTDWIESSWRVVLQYSTGWNYGVWIHNGNVLYQYGADSGWVDVWGSTQLPLTSSGTPMHVAICIDRSNTAYDAVTFWFNGVADDTQIVEKSNGDHDVDTNGDPVYNPFNLGGSWNLSLNNAHIGMLDEVRISDVIRYQIPEPSMMLLALGALAFFRKK